MFGTPGLPAWVAEFRPHQWDAIQEALELYRSGMDVVFMDAPTGSGKTLIGETIRRLISPTDNAQGDRDQGRDRQAVSRRLARSLYVCSGKSLQDQFLHDYPYAAVLKGRSNYPTQSMPYPDISCADCTKTPNDEECDWCPEVWKCGYEQAKGAAMRSPIAVVNTSYLLAEANNIGNIVRGRDLMIMDECDVLEKELMGFVEFSMAPRTLEGLGLSAPAKGIHRKNIVRWFMEDLLPAVEKEYRGLSGRSSDVRVLRRRTQMQRLMQEVPRVAAEIQDDNWVRDNKAGPITMKPVKVDGYGKVNLWDHGKKWLCMSATIVSADEMVESLGLRDREWGIVRVPMTFPVENRPIRAVPVASMTYKEKDEAHPKMAQAIVRIAEAHPEERILVHAVSYDLTKYLHREVGRRVARDRAVVTYTGAAERDSAIATYRRNPGAILIAPSLDRGVDFKGDDCRVVVVAKVPYPSLGDTQVSQRMHSPGGQQWYNVQTIRSLVQMTGRGVRSEDDWCVTYILDKQFLSNVWKRGRMLFPEWWSEAMDNRYDGRWLYK
jgi:Rad3-related DNA helicase